MFKTNKKSFYILSLFEKVYIPPENRLPMKIGYCPTMEEYVKKRVDENKNRIINLGSAAQVLSFLNINEIDVGVIGRKAKKQEFKGYEKRIRKGFTLITNMKNIIGKEELKNIEVHTALSKKIIEEKYPDLKNVFYHDSLQDALKDGEVQLISWDDWNDNFELLIPVDEFNNKDTRFRVPHFYSKDKSLIEEIVPSSN